MPDGDLLRNVKFVKLTAVIDLPYAEAIQAAMRRGGVGAVIINDEKFQSRPDEERADASAPPGGFRIEVPEGMLSRAQEILAGVIRSEEPL